MFRPQVFAGGLTFYSSRFYICQLFKGAFNKFLSNIFYKFCAKHFYFYNILCYNLYVPQKCSVTAQKT